MSKINSISWALIALNVIIAIIAYLNIDPTQQVAIHWNLESEVDRRASPLIAFFGIPIIAIIIHITLLALKYFEPKRKNLAQSGKLYGANILLLASLMLVIQIIIVGAEFQFFTLTLNKFMPILGITLIIVSNYMPKSLPTHSMGIRTRWNINNEQNWRQTHRLAGKLGMLGGVAIIAAGFLSKDKDILSAALLIGSLSPLLLGAGYSWYLGVTNKVDGNVNE